MLTAHAHVDRLQALRGCLCRYPTAASFTCRICKDGIAGLADIRARRHPLLEGHVGAGALRRLQVRREGDQQAVALQVGAAALEGRVPGLQLRPAGKHDAVGTQTS